MAIQAAVYYWPTKNWGFGHVSIKVFNPEDTTYFVYISWAEQNSLLDDKSKYEIKPTIITLPILSEKNYDAFLDYYNQSEYFYGYNQKVSRGAYGDSYHSLTHNCAHVIRKMLHQVGYTTEPAFALGLRPVTVARQASEIAQLQLKQERREIKAKTINISHYDKVNKLISNTLQQLQAAVIQNENEIGLLKELQVEDTLESVVNLLKVINQCCDSTARALHKCLGLLDENKITLARIYLQAQEMQKNANDLEQQGDNEDCATAKALAVNLQSKTTNCFKKINDLNEFHSHEKKHPIKTIITGYKKECTDLIADKKEVLEKYPAWKKLLGNISLLILGLGVGYLAAAIYNKVQTGRFLFFNEPEYLQNVRCIKESLCGLEHTTNISTSTENVNFKAKNFARTSLHNRAKTSSRLMPEECGLTFPSGVPIVF